MKHNKYIVFFNLINHVDNENDENINIYNRHVQNKPAQRGKRGNYGQHT